MRVVIPFRAVRPTQEFVKDVASYPYDIVDSDEARAIAEGNERSFLHVVKAEIDLPPGTDIYTDVVYEKAKENFYKFLDKRILFQDNSPCFYVYRLQMGTHKQDGIVGCASIDAYKSMRIRKHELTRADKENDRTRHIKTLNAQTGPVFLIYRAQETIDHIVEKIVTGSPEYDFTADDGIAHTVWVIDDETAIDAIEKEFLKIDYFYIADGHHRAASAAAVAEKRQTENSSHNGSEQYNYMMAVIFPHNQLKVLDYNRVIADLNDLSETEFLERVRESFHVRNDFTKKTPGTVHEFGMYLGGQWYGLTAKEEICQGRDVVGVLDVSILQNYLLDPVLGIRDPRTDDRITFVGGIRGMAELEKLIDSGNYAVAFSLYPTTMQQLMNVADEGKMMPPKSTWFEPKLRSGLFTHLLE